MKRATTIEDGRELFRAQAQARDDARADRAGPPIFVDPLRPRPSGMVPNYGAIRRAPTPDNPPMEVDE